MNDFKAEVVRVDRVETHPNADRLELVYIRGWQVVVRKGDAMAGSLVVYLPIDSVLPPDLEADLFPPDSKVKLSKSRVKTIKLRGSISQGMIVSLNDASIEKRLSPHFNLRPNGTVDLYEGTDVTDILGITKYEPPIASYTGQAGGGTKVRIENPYFDKYEKLSHFKNYPELFQEGEDVIVTEKIHGTNFRAGWVPAVADTFWKRIKKFFRMLPKWEFVYGSHNVQLQNKWLWTGYYKKNVYADAVEKYNLAMLIPKGVVIYGEIYGPGIQKGYGYGVPSGETRLAIFDAKQADTLFTQYLSWGHMVEIANRCKLPTAPIIYDGPFHKAWVTAWEQGPSLAGEQLHREGCVIKARSERKVLRAINPEYLLINETDFH